MKIFFSHVVLAASPCRYSSIERGSFTARKSKQLQKLPNSAFIPLGDWRALLTGLGFFSAELWRHSRAKSRSVNEDSADYNACAGAAGWRLSAYETVGSTNDLARALSGWNAVRADRQTGGRGRLGRKFVSDEGGLWLSPVPSRGRRPGPLTGFLLARRSHALRTIHGISALRGPASLAE